MPPSPAPQHYSAVGLHFPYSSFCYLNAYTSSSFALDLLCQIQSQVNFDFPNCVFACLDHVSQVAVPAFPNLYTSFSPVKVARSLFFIHTGLLEFCNSYILEWTILKLGRNDPRILSSFLWLVFPLGLYLMGLFQTDHGSGQSRLTKSRDTILLLVLLPSFRILHSSTSW